MSQEEITKTEDEEQAICERVLGHVDSLYDCIRGDENIEKITGQILKALGRRRKHITGESMPETAGRDVAEELKDAVFETIRELATGKDSTRCLQEMQRRLVRIAAYDPVKIQRIKDIDKNVQEIIRVT